MEPERGRTEHGIVLGDGGPDSRVINHAAYKCDPPKLKGRNEQKMENVMLGYE